MIIKLKKLASSVRTPSVAHWIAAFVYVTKFSAMNHPAWQTREIIATILAALNFSMRITLKISTAAIAKPSDNINLY